VEENEEGGEERKGRLGSSLDGEGRENQKRWLWYMFINKKEGLGRKEDDGVGGVGTSSCLPPTTVSKCPMESERCESVRVSVYYIFGAFCGMRVFN
jgi:hypothetical protein